MQFIGTAEGEGAKGAEVEMAGDNGYYLLYETSSWRVSLPVLPVIALHVPLSIGRVINYFHWNSQIGLLFWVIRFFFYRFAAIHSISLPSL